MWVEYNIMVSFKWLIKITLDKETQNWLMVLSKRIKIAMYIYIYIQYINDWNLLVSLD